MAFSRCRVAMQSCKFTDFLRNCLSLPVPLSVDPKTLNHGYLQPTPVITRGPVDVSVFLSDHGNLSLPCEYVNGSGMVTWYFRPNSYQTSEEWIKLGKAGFPAGAKQEGNSLVFDEATPMPLSSVGSYLCKVSVSGVGSVVSHPAKITQAGQYSSNVLRTCTSTWSLALCLGCVLIGSSVSLAGCRILLSLFRSLMYSQPQYCGGGGMCFYSQNGGLCVLAFDCIVRHYVLFFLIASHAFHCGLCLTRL